MKKTVIALFATFAFAATGMAQHFSVWEHVGSYPLSQCYNILEMSDGNFVVKEAVFDENQNDIGYNLYKLTPSGEAVDSLFVEAYYIYGTFPMLRDPNSANSNIMVSYYTDGGKKNYRATYFNDSLEITDIVEREYPDSLTLPARFLIDSDNDLVCRLKSSNGVYRFVKMGLDGEIKFVSDQIELGIEYSVPENCLFELSCEPRRYGYVTFTRYTNKMIMRVLDSEFNVVKEKVENKVGDWLIYAFNLNTCRINDGHFLLTFEVMRGALPTIGAICVAEFNSELELERQCVWGEHDMSTFNRSMLVNKNIALTDNGMYIAWYRKTVASKDSKINLMVTCLDRELNHEWERATLVEYNGRGFGNYGMTATENGGVALSGWRASDNPQYYYQSKEIYAIVFDNDTWSTSEVTSDGTPLLCYPNPSNGVINLSFAESVECHSAEIFSTDGRLVKSQTRDFESIDISGLNAGIYLLKLRLSDGTELTERIVKE